VKNLNKGKIICEYKCRDCGILSEYETYKGMEWMHPTICEQCYQKREDELRNKEVLKRKEETLAEINMLPYPVWDSKVGNNSLRNTIGKRVFTNGEFTPVSLWVYGPTGVGKTRCVCSVARTVIEREGHVNFVNCLGILHGYSNEFMDLQGSTELYMSRLGTDKRILIIDDVGMGKITERGAELLYFIVNERLIRELPTWYTSNFHPSYIRKWFSSKLAQQAKNIERRIMETTHIIEGEE
jgi:DNA replication protein DnaC